MYNRKLTVTKLFEDKVSQIPYKTAVKNGNETITYYELNAQANKLARFASKYDVKKEDIVAIFMERSILMVKAILATWKCGAAYVLLNPDHSDERINEMLQIVKPKLIISNCKIDVRRNVAASDIKILNIEKEASEINKLSCENLDVDIKPENICYVFFTSGSTGKPKGAMAEHGGVLNHILAKISDIKLSHNANMAQTASQNFNIFNWQTFGPLISGATTVIYSDNIISAPKILINSLIRDKINFIQISPSYLNVLLDYLEDGSNKISSLERLLLTGEPVKPLHISRWFTLYPHIPILNSYGCTEVSDDSAHMLITETIKSNQHVPIGRPIPNTTIYIVKTDEDGKCVFDDEMKPILCEEDEIGEIWLSGDIVVGRGYVDNKVETEKYFAKDTFTGERLFKIGDLGYRNSDGNIFCLGRKDSQLKINGQRIDLFEIETQILSHSSEIKDIVIIPQKDICENMYLTAYFTASKKYKITELRGFNGILKHLPPSMVPTFWIQLNEMPILKESGKIDKRALNMQNGELLGQIELNKLIRADIELPRDDEERMLVKIWAEVLQFDDLGITEANIGINECFFNLGGDSLKAALLAKKLEEKGYELIMKNFSQASAIKEREGYLKRKNQDISNKLVSHVFESEWESTSLGRYFKDLGFHMFTIDQLMHDFESQGKEVIRMTLGKSDRPLHDSVKCAMKNVLDRQEDILKVDSQGNEKFRTEASKYISNRFGVEIPTKNIIVGSQGTSSIYRDLFLILLQNGGEVLLPNPGYILYYASAYLAKALGGKEVRIRSYDIDLESNTVDINSFEANFDADNTRIVVVNSPGNPTGNLVSESEWEKMIKIINSGKHSVVISDQVYSNIVFEGKRYPSILDEKLRNSIERPFIITDSMSKGFEMYTFRVGYAIIPDELFDPLLTFQRNFSLTPNTISQFGAIEALRQQESVESLKRLYEERNNYAVEAFNNVPNIEVVKSCGGFYFLLNCKEFIDKNDISGDLELAKIILNETSPHVGTTPGSDFGAPGFLRISYSPKDFEKGIDLMVNFFNSEDRLK